MGAYCGGANLAIEPETITLLEKEMNALTAVKAKSTPNLAAAGQVVGEALKPNPYSPGFFYGQFAPPMRWSSSPL